MTQDVRQWLAEIRHLQQKLAEAHQERDQAFASATNWRSLYETEAKQRRTETQLLQQTIEDLKRELQHQETGILNREACPSAIAAHQERVQRLHSIDALKQELLSALLECDRLSQVLREEKESHQQTHRELTLALGDTVDVLAHERAQRERLQIDPSGQATKTPATNGQGQHGDGNSEIKAQAKSPSLEQPPTDPVRSHL